MSKPRHVRAARLIVGLLVSACGGQLDAGSDAPHGALPVDERSPTVLVNDGALDNWQGEYAAVLAATGELKLVGLVVNSNAEYPSVDANVTSFRQMIRAARDSGMKHLPDPTASIASKLSRPASGSIDDTVPNRSEGARLLLDAAATFATKVHPLAIATGGALTDVADAYLLDNTLAERAVVVASAGQSTDGGARLLDPNANRDPWATFIVTSRMRYVQVNGYYDQTLDFPEARVSELPANPFGSWIAQKRAGILGVLVACDQVSVLSVGFPWFATEVNRMRLDDVDSTFLLTDPNGPLWLVSKSDSNRARAELWSRLEDPSTYR